MSETASAEKLSKEGKTLYQAGDYLAAAHTFEAARQAYLTTQDTLNAAEMANNASVAYLQAGENQSALNAAEGTPAIFEAAGDLRRQGMALGNFASALEALERLDEALDYYRQSADCLQQAGEDQLRLKSLQSLSALQFRSGKQLQALATMQDGLEGINRPNALQRLLKKLLRIPFEMFARGKRT